MSSSRGFHTGGNVSPFNPFRSELIILNAICEHPMLVKIFSQGLYGHPRHAASPPKAKHPDNSHLSKESCTARQSP